MSEISSKDRSASGAGRSPDDADNDDGRWTPATIALAAGARREAYIRLALVGGVSLILFALYFNTFAQMARVWVNSVTFRHGLVIFPICAGLIWARRQALAAPPLKPAWWGLPGLLVLALGWVLGWLTDVNVVQELAVIAMLPLLVITIMGAGVFRTLRFPLLYVFFAVPLGWFLVEPLMHVTASMAVTGLKISGVPVLQDGFRISVPTGDFLVAHACSGIRYVIACLALGTLFAYLFYRSWPRRLAFMAVALVVPVIANGIRAYGIILLAYLSNMRIATGFDHEIYGFIFFSFILFVMFWLGSLFREDTAAAPQLPQGQANPRASGLRIVRRLAIAAPLSVVIIALGPLISAGVDAWGGEMPQAAAGMLFKGGKTWHGPASVTSAWHPHFVGQHQQLSAEYHQAGRQVELLVEGYAYPHKGHGVVSSLNRVTDNPYQLIDASQYQVTKLGRPQSTLSVHQSVVQTTGGRRLVWSWYRIAGQSTVNRLMEKVYEALDILRGGSGWAQWVSVSTSMHGSLAAAQFSLRDFLQDNYRPLVACLSTKKAAAVCAP